jgi:beta-lactamase superfamily II metal-dependent hydrolase
MSKFTIEMLPARQGDALWIEYGDSAHPRRALIDAGTPETWDVVRPKIEQLAPAERRFELLVVSHIDLDHIGGVLPLLAAAKDLEIEFDDVWFNGFRHLPQGELEPMGPVEGEKLTNLLVKGGHTWNGAFDGKAVVVPDGKAPPVKKLDGGLELTLLSPCPQQLADLRPVWEPLVKTHGLDPKTEPDVPAEPPGLEHLGPPQTVDELAEAKFKADSAEANGSSIVVLAEFEGKRALLCADGFPEIIRGCVERLVGDAPDDRLKVDAFKLPHHGSRRNINLALLERIRSPLHLFSSDGTKTEHPNQEAVARTIVTQKAPELRFNYRTKFNEMWDAGSDKAPPANGHKWKAEFPAAGTTGALVELL